MAENPFEKRPTHPRARSSSSQSEGPIPTAIGPYQLEALYRRGGMSTLFLGKEPQTGDPVIVKVLDRAYLAHPDALARFHAEAEILTKTDHPNIVKLLSQGRWEHGLYITMEYVHGESLRDWIEYHPLSLRRAVEIILEVAYALCHLHTQGVVHRDLKPENILVTENGTPKLIDFGIAQMLAETNQEAHQGPSRFMGTPVYVSPEQRDHPESVTYASDIYSLGIIAYETVLGKLSHGQVQLSRVPRGMQKILARALQPKPEERYQDIVDLISDLSAYINSSQLEEESNIGDQLSELSEHLHEAQVALLPEQPPKWTGVEVGVAGYTGHGIGGVYFDFFEMGRDVYAVVLTEPMAKGVGGLTYTAVVRGMMKTLSRLTTHPNHLVTVLNDMILRDGVHPLFSLSYLLLSPKENQFRYISCGRSHLWHLVAADSMPRKVAVDNPALGLRAMPEFTEVTCTWRRGDLLYLHTIAMTSAEGSPKGPLMTEEQLCATLVEIRSLAPQKQVDILRRKAKPPASHPLEKQSLSVIAIHRQPSSEP